MQVAPWIIIFIAAGQVRHHAISHYNVDTDSIPSHRVGPFDACAVWMQYRGHNLNRSRINDSNSSRRTTFWSDLDVYFVLTCCEQQLVIINPLGAISLPGDSLKVLTSM